MRKAVVVSRQRRLHRTEALCGGFTCDGFTDHLLQGVNSQVSRQMGQAR